MSDEPVDDDRRGHDETDASWVERSAKTIANRRLESARAYGSFATAGTAFAFSIIIGAVLGVWLDRITGWSPVCFVVFFVLGFGAGIRSVYLTTKRMK